MEQGAEVISIADARDARGRDGTQESRSRCAATTEAGRPCRNYATDGQLCRVHAVQGGEPATDTDPATSDAAASDPATSGTGASDPAAPDPVSPDPGASDPAAPDRVSTDAVAGVLSRLSRHAAAQGWLPPTDGLAAVTDSVGGSLVDHLGDLAAFLRRRVTGDYEIDEFGFDDDLTTNLLMPLVRPLHRHYWRISSHGQQHLPQQGGGLVVANHAGTLPADAVMTRLDIFEHTGRHARELGADLVFKTPFVGEWARKTGATLASGDDADRLLAQGELVAVWPEGFKGLGKPWKDRYKLQRFGRGGFVATALRAQVPIVPTAIVGSEEIWPMVYDLKLLARALGLPYFPVVAQMFALPVLGPLALLPLPSKWIIEYGEPIDTSAYGPEAADDPMVVFDLADRVRDTIQGLLHRNLMGRRSVFL
jgi:1-acyl-sn-glycerol-3-phosphate acyltransferase